MLNHRTCLLCAGLAALAPACGSDPAPGPQTAGEAAPASTGATPAAAPVEQKADMASPTSGSVQLDDRIVKACGDLPTPRFSFDSASITGDAANMLGAVARCFVDGPLKGRSIKLVGHADPRGEADYNLALGQERAQSVAKFLHQNGLEPSRVTTMSKGEFAATGTDEEGWARDRRVQVLLAD